MIAFLARRFVGGVITLAIFVAGLFFLVSLLLPGDWTSQFIMTAEARAALQESLGIDRPIHEQFWTWVSNVAVLDLGTSFGGEPVWTAVRQAMATTLFVFVAATLVAFPLGFWLGRTVAWNQKPWVAVPSTGIAVLFFTAFPPAIAFLIERGITNLLSAQTLRTITELDADRWAFERGGRFRPPPATTEGLEGALTPPQALWRMLAIAFAVFVVVLVVRWLVRALTGRLLSPGVVALLIGVGALVGWRLSGFSGQAFDIASTMLLLIGALVLLSYGEILLVTEAAMFDTREEDFVLTARAKGLPEQAVRDRHSARAAILPILSRLVVSLPYFLTGLVILEYVFQVEGGLGSLIFRAITNQDTPLIVGAMVMVGALTLALRLALDVAIAALDPRVRLTGTDTP